MKSPRLLHQIFGAQRTRHFVSLLLVAGIPCMALLITEHVRPYFFLYDDNATYFLPSYTYNWQAIMQYGEIPHMNFHQSLGQTHLSQGQSGVLYLPTYLAYGLALLLGNPRMVIDVLAITHIIFASIGMYYLLRRHVSSTSLQVLGAVTWATLPFIVIVPRSWIIVSFFLALLPLHMVCLERLVEQPTWKNAFWLGLVKVVVFLQGNVQYLIMLVVFDALYILLCRTRLRVWLTYSFNYFFVICMSAPLLLPMTHTVLISADRSAEMSLDSATKFTLPFFATLKAQFLLFSPEVILWAGSQIFYIGIPLISVLLLTLFMQKGAHCVRTHTFGWLSLATFLLCTPFVILLYQFPLYDRLRWPFRYFMFFAFFFLLFVIMRTATVQHRRYIYVFLIVGIFCNVYVTLLVQTPQATMAAIRGETPPAEILSVVREGGRVFAWRTWLDNNAKTSLLGHYMATQYAFDHFAGYDPLLSRQNFNATLGIQHHAVFRGTLTPAVVETLRTWNVRWIITAPVYKNMRELSQVTHARLRVATSDYLLYELMDTLPYVRLASEPNRSLQYTRTINSIYLSVSASDAETLIVSVLPLPFLRVYVDGKPVTVNTGAQEPLKIPLTYGEHTVRIVYSTILFRIGLCMTISALFVVGLLWYKERSKKSAPELQKGV